MTRPLATHKALRPERKQLRAKLRRLGTLVRQLARAEAVATARARWRASKLAKAKRSAMANAPA